MMLGMWELQMACSEHASLTEWLGVDLQSNISLVNYDRSGVFMKASGDLFL